jgi:phage baseplate assembly protein gpV
MEALHVLMAPQTEHARKRLVQGLVTAKVRSREDDGTYRLDYLTMGSDEPSAPARVMMPMAGGKRGTYFFPEPGDEVVVAFELGDTNLPVILGAVWNQNDPFPDQAQPSSQNNIRTIVSRSGHELTFDDTPGAEKVTVKTTSGHQLVMDDTPIGPKVTLTTNQGRTLVLDDTPPGQASMSTPVGASVTLSDTGTLTLSAPTMINLQTDGIINMTAALGITLTATTGPIAVSAPAAPIALTAPSGIALTTDGIPYPAGSLVVIA